MTYVVLSSDIDEVLHKILVIVPSSCDRDRLLNTLFRQFSVNAGLPNYSHCRPEEMIFSE